jgi:AraC family transcriptional regulator
MRVASVYGFGKEPEGLAHDKLQAWAKPKGYLDNPEHHRVFGFNNPNPSPSSPNYGYELWITVDPTVEPEGDVRIMDFKGGLYAVTRCVIRGDQYDVIGATWKKLGMWCEDSKYQFASHQWLEEHLLVKGTPEGDWALDLYMPIAE